MTTNTHERSDITCMHQYLKPLVFLVFLNLWMPMQLGAQASFNSVWHFGQNCRLDFSSGTPVAGFSEINTNEGSSSISDANGLNLFYTDGTQIWKADGTALLTYPTILGGGSSSTQSSLIVPAPGDASKFYIFTTAPQLDNSGPISYHGTNVSVFNPSANNGLGDFDYMNTVLLDSSCEKLTAIKKCGEENYWIIAHKWNSADYYAWELSSAGLGQPVVSTVGNVIPFDSNSFTSSAESIGYLKASSDGRKIAAAQTFRIPATIELFDFDFSTGILSNPMSHTISESGDYSAYGICFSPDDTKLYVTEVQSVTFFDSKLIQYNAQPATELEFGQSRTQVGAFNEVLGAIEIGPDNKLYISRVGATNLAIIQDPNLPANQCNFQLNGVELLANTQCRFGLQNVVAASLYDISNMLIIPDTVSTCGTSIELDYLANIGSIQWSTGDTTHQTLVENDGFYFLEVSTQCALVKDTVYAIFSGNFSLELPQDTLLCFADSLLLLPSVSNPNFDFQWSTGQTTLPITISDSGLYLLQMSNDFCSKTDSISIDFKPIPYVDLGSDKTLCNKETAQLGHFYPNVNFLWSDGSNDSVLTVSTAGSYWLTISNNACESSDTIHIKDASAAASLTIPNTFSPNNDLINDAFVAGDTTLLEYSMAVFNRWGQEVFQSQNPTQFWKGDYKETLAPEGVYMWVCRFFDPCSDSVMEKKGTVSVFR